MKNLAKDHPKIGSMVKIFPTVHLREIHRNLKQEKKINSAKSKIYSGKSTKRGFFKKRLARINFFSLVLGSYESPEGLEC